jgi:hypothetical protein
MLLLRRQREKQRRQPRINVQLEPGDDQSHTQGMTPDSFATTQLAIAIVRPGRFHRASNTLGVSHRQTVDQGLQGVFEVALGGDRVGN